MIDIEINSFVTEIRPGAKNSSASNKVRLFSRIENGVVLSQIMSLRVCYMFRPVHRPSSSTSMQKTYK